LPEVFYNNPDYKTHHEDLPYHAEYPSDGHQKAGVSIVVISALVDARNDLWHSPDEPDALESFVHDSSLPFELRLIPVAVIAPPAIVRTTKITMRKTSIFIDP
jgi:hypothetical protein